VTRVVEGDRLRWDERYASLGPPGVRAVAVPDVFAAHADVFPTTGRALDLACGQGLGSVWLARRGLEVLGWDVSPVAVGHARDLARRSGVGGRCRFEVVDFDDGLPAGPPVEVVLCHRFRDPRLDRAVIARVARGGLLAVAVLSEVGRGPGPYRAAAGELPRAFADLDVLATGEGEGHAWLLARA
jgi:SAM-dependent methyltransferase